MQWLQFLVFSTICQIWFLNYFLGTNADVDNRPGATFNVNSDDLASLSHRDGLFDTSSAKFTVPISESVPNSSVSSYRGVVFLPETLRYTRSPVCIPTVADFSIENKNDFDIYLYSVTSNSAQFYPVLFQPQTLRAKSSISVQLLFLPYQVETTEAKLTISSSEGNLDYIIHGQSIKNPYYLHPFVGFRIPTGVPIEQPIKIFNPHPEVLHIREIFTTEDFLSLKEITSSAVGDAFHATGVDEKEINGIVDGLPGRNKEGQSKEQRQPHSQHQPSAGKVIGANFGLWEIGPGEQR